MSFRANVTRIQECCDEFFCCFNSDDSAAKTDQIHVVIFYPLMRGKAFMNQSGSDSGYFVCANRRTNSAAADRDAVLYFTRCYRPCKRYHIIWIVIGLIEGICSKIFYLMPRGSKPRFDFLL